MEYSLCQRSAESYKVTLVRKNKHTKSPTSKPNQTAVYVAQSLFLVENLLFRVKKISLSFYNSLTHSSLSLSSSIPNLLLMRNRLSEQNQFLSLAIYHKPLPLYSIFPHMTLFRIGVDENQMRCW